MHQFYKGEFFNFEVIRILGTTRTGGADVAEVLDAVGQIKENDPVTWHKAWSMQAEKVEQLADEALSNGHRNSARMAYLRAANYQRASAYMMCSVIPTKSDPRVVPILRKTVELFRKAIPLANNPIHIFEIPYEEGVKLPAYLYLPQSSCRIAGKIPLVVNPIGADGMQEEVYHMYPAEGPELGYAVLTFEGPGQGLTLHEHNVPMRPDYEVVDKIVLDYVQKYAEQKNLELDFDRVAIAGTSLSGYFALRAAVDPRYKACVAVDPLFDFWDFATKQVSATFLNTWLKGWIPDSFVDNMIWFGNKFDFQMRWNIAMSARFFGVSTPTEILRAMKLYTLRQGKGTYLDKVTCPVFVTGAGKSLWLEVDDHTSMVFNALTNQKESDKELWVATKPGEGGLQAKMGAIALCNQKVFQWLDKRFNIQRYDIKYVKL